MGQTETSRVKDEEIRRMFRNLVMDNIETMQKDLDALKPNERIKAVLDLVKYILPAGSGGGEVDASAHDFENRIKELLERKKGDI